MTEMTARLMCKDGYVFFVRFLSAKDNTRMGEEFEPKMCHTLSYIMYKTSTNVEELQA